MKNLLLLLTMFTPALANAGVMNGGGGKSVVCRDNSGAIQSIELLDLYEARALFGLPKGILGNSVDDILSNVKRRLDSSMEGSQERLLPLFGEITKKMRIMPPGSKLEPIEDVAPIALPSGCKLEQTAGYIEREKRVFVDGEHWQSMDEYNRAALITHEAVYKYTRSEGFTDSSRARKITGHALSDFSFEKVTNGIPRNAWKCRADHSHSYDSEKPTFAFYMFPSALGDTKVQFVTYFKTQLFSRTVATLPIAFPWPSSERLHAPKEAETKEIESNFESFIDSVKFTFKRYYLGSNAQLVVDGAEFDVGCEPLSNR